MRTTLLTGLILILSGTTALAQQYVISTVAGSGDHGFSGDGGPATNAGLNYPNGVAVDSLQNLYIADTANNRVRKVDTAGVITTVAGNGTKGFSGDCPYFDCPGSATKAALNDPADVAVDSAGNLYIADYDNYRIRMVTNGSIHTIAGNGTSALVPVGLAAAGPVRFYVADPTNNRVLKYSNGLTTVAGNGKAGFSGDGGLATYAALYAPVDVAVDSAGNLYIADKGNNRIRMVDTAGTITTVAGNGSRGFSGDGGPATSAALYYPSSVAVDGAGNLYIADTYNHRIRKVTNGVITTIAGNGTDGFAGDGGLATDAALNYPGGLAVDGAGNLYMADNNRIRKLSNAVISNLVPSVTRLSPTNVVAGSSAFTLTVSGSNFVPGSVVRWNGGDRNTTFISSTQLQAAISSGDIASPGTAQIAVFNPPPGGGTSGSVAFVVLSQSMSRIGSFAQVASGGGWKTTMTLVNLSNSAVAARMSFYADDGSPLQLPLAFPLTSSTSTSSFASLTIAPKSSVVVESEATTAEIATGWTDVQASGALSGYLIFRRRSPELPDLEGTVPLDTQSSSSLVLPFDNTNGYLTGFALANQASISATITAILLDENGNQIASSSINLPGLGHAAFYINQLFSQSTNRLGIIQFLKSSGGITGTGLRFNPSGSFTSVPIIHP